MTNTKLIAAILFLILSFNVHAVSHINKDIEVIQSPDSRPCVFFKLVGVSEADPVKSGNAWFSIPLSHVGIDQFYSMLLTAKTASNKIDVITTGTLECGHASVQSIQLK